MNSPANQAGSAESRAWHYGDLPDVEQVCIECHREPMREDMPFCGHRCALAYKEGNSLDPAGFRDLLVAHAGGHIWNPRF